MVFSVAFEMSLALIGWAICERRGVELLDQLQVVDAGLMRLALGLAPMLAALAWVSRSRLRGIVELREQVRRLTGWMFAGARWWELAAVALAAGIGEEVLFRGALQPWASLWFGPAAGLLLASLAFGAVHAVTWTYFTFATAVGLYLGWLANWCGELVTPIGIHALYDFVALWILQRSAAEPFEAPAASGVSTVPSQFEANTPGGNGGP